MLGTNCMDWNTHEIRHVFSDKEDSNNVQCVFFRFEFQNRNSIHLHMLGMSFQLFLYDQLILVYFEDFIFEFGFASILMHLHAYYS